MAARLCTLQLMQGMRVVRLLLQKMAPANVLDAQGCSPLHLAISENIADVVRELLEFGDAAALVMLMKPRLT
mgnify:CR=1 FL=1